MRYGTPCPRDLTPCRYVRVSGYHLTGGRGRTKALAVAVSTWLRVDEAQLLTLLLTAGVDA